MSSSSERALSFGAAARNYDQWRIGPSVEVVDWLLTAGNSPADSFPAGSSSVLDLAAGTGMLTRILAERVDEVLAVEPDGRMRQVLVETCRLAEVFEGTAENIPLPDSRVDAVLVSAAWHWMTPHLALPEIARVLKPGGTFGLLWVHPDVRVPWVADLERLARDDGGGWHAARRTIDDITEQGLLPGDSPFADTTSRVFSWTVPMTREELFGLYTTYSWFQEHTEQRKREFWAQIDTLFPEQAETIQLPMSAPCWRTQLAE